METKSAMVAATRAATKRAHAGGDIDRSTMSPFGLFTVMEAYSSSSHVCPTRSLPETVVRFLGNEYESGCS